MKKSEATIFVLSTNRYFGGAEKSIASVLPELARRARVVVFASNPAHLDDLRATAGDSLDVVNLPLLSSPISALRSLWLVWWMCIDRQPDAVLANGHRASVLLFLLRWLPFARRPRSAVYVRDFAYTSFRFTLWAMRDFLFLAPSAAIFEHPRYQTWGLGRHQCRVLPNCVVSVSTSDPPPLHQGYIGCCARLVPWKGIEYLIQAFARIAPIFPETKVRIHGEAIDPKYADSLTELVNQNGLSQQVEFRSFSKETNRIYRDGLFFVVPSLSVLPGPESFSRVIIEAWASARPVIAFDCGGPSLLIEDGVDGFLVEERNVEKLAARMAELLRSPQLTQKMGEAGAFKAVLNFSAEPIARQLFTLLTDDSSSAESATNQTHLPNGTYSAHHSFDRR